MRRWGLGTARAELSSGKCLPRPKFPRNSVNYIDSAGYEIRLALAQGPTLFDLYELLLKARSICCKIKKHCLTLKEILDCL